MKAVDNVQYIGKIDLDIYRVVTDDIRTDDVVLSDAQRKHIQESHPEDYKEFSQHLQTSNDPDRFMNSVITFQHVEEKRYRRYIKNVKILYQREGL